MYINAKMIPVEIVPGFGEGGMKERSRRGNSSLICLIHCKNLCEYSNVLPPTKTII
jgi:hypothetical protein